MRVYICNIRELCVCVGGRIIVEGGRSMAASRLFHLPRLEVQNLILMYVKIFVFNEIKAKPGSFFPSCVCSWRGGDLGGIARNGPLGRRMLY